MNIITSTIKNLNSLTTEQLQLLLNRQKEIEQEATDGDFNSHEFANAEHLGISYGDYWRIHLWEYLGLVDYEINQQELLMQRIKYLQGQHELQEMLTKMVGGGSDGVD